MTRRTAGGRDDPSARRPVRASGQEPDRSERRTTEFRGVAAVVPVVCVVCVVVS
jgi:hypothetical protein